jgi:hypothetical protein
MFKSSYATKYTRDMFAGKTPSIDAVNRKAQQQPQRKAAWESREAAKASAKA